MKVCHLTTAHFWNDPRIYYKQCCSLQESGHEVVLLAPNAPNKIVGSVEVKGVKCNRKSRFERFFKVRRKLYKMVLEIEPDILHFHDPDFLPYAIRLEKKGIKTIYDVHENYIQVIRYKEWIPKIVKGIIARTFGYLEIYVSKKITGVITATNYIENRFKENGVNTITIKNYPKLSDFSNLSSKKTSKTIKICYAGTISRENCIRELVDSLAELENVQLHLIGWGFQKNYLDEIKESEGWNKVILKQHVDQAEVIRTMGSSNIGVALYKNKPGLEFTISTKIHEYMVVGIPFVTSNFGNMKKLVEDHNCGITVDPTNPKAIRAGIQQLITSPNKRNTMGLRGKDISVKKYSWDIEHLKLCQFYSKIINNENNFSR